MNLRTEFQLYKSKFAWVRQFWGSSQKFKNLKKFERLDRFWPNLITKFLDGCNIFVCSFRTIARMLRKLEVLRPFSKNLKSHKIKNRHQLSWKESRLEGCDCFTGVLNFISISQAVYELSGFQTLESGYPRTHTHTSGRQLKITFFDVLYYSEYSNTNMSKKKFSRKQSFLSEEAKSTRKFQSFDS